MTETTDLFAQLRGLMQQGPEGSPPAIRPHGQAYLRIADVHFGLAKVIGERRTQQTMQPAEVEEALDIADYINDDLMGRPTVDTAPLSSPDWLRQENHFALGSLERMVGLLVSAHTQELLEPDEVDVHDFVARVGAEHLVISSLFQWPPHILRDNDPAALYDPAEVALLRVQFPDVTPTNFQYALTRFARRKRMLPELLGILSTETGDSRRIIARYLRGEYSAGSRAKDS